MFEYIYIQYSILIIFITYNNLAYSCSMPKVDCMIYKVQHTTTQYIVTLQNISTTIYNSQYSRSVQKGLMYCIISIYDNVMYLDIIIVLHLILP